MRLHSTQTRDSSLRKLSVINRWTIAASVALTGVLTDVAAHAFPSKKPTRPTSKSGSQNAKRHSAQAHSSTPSRKPQPPAQAPEARAEPPAVEEPAQPSPPAEESAATPEAEAAPEREAAPEAAPEPAPAQQAPVEEPSAPVVSGGS